jgi:hypothetical protein
MRPSYAASQGAAEYGAVTSGSATAASSGGSPLLDRLPMDLLSDPIAIAVAAAGLLVIIGLLKTRRYRS